jgi:membrane-associated protein
MQDFFATLTTHHSHFMYAILFLIAVIEGPIVSVAAGILVKLGDMHFLPVYLSLMAGDITGDILWYVLGATAGTKFIRRFGKYFSLTDAHIKRVTDIFRDHTYKILMISKLTTGLGFAPLVLFTAGLAGVSFRTYLCVNMLGQLAWSGLLIGIGYFFGHTYSLLNTGFEKLSLIAVSALITAVILRYGMYLRNKIISNPSTSL